MAGEMGEGRLAAAREAQFPKCGLMAGGDSLFRKSARAGAQMRRGDAMTEPDVWARFNQFITLVV
jgi:hypothetical protein